LDEEGTLDCRELALEPAGSLEVQLVGGDPAHYAECLLEVATARANRPCVAFDVRGVLTVEGLDPGWIDASIYLPDGRGRVDRGLELRSGEDWNVEFVLDSPPFLEVEVLPPEVSPLVDGMCVGVAWRTKGGARAAHFERLDERLGSLTFGGVEGDLAVVEVFDPALTSIAAEAIRLEGLPAQHVEIPLDPSRRRLRFLDARGGALAAKEVRISLAGCEGFWFEDSCTSAEGEIELLGVRAAEVRADIDLGAAGRALGLRIPLDGAVEQSIDVRVDTTYGTGAACKDLAGASEPVEERPEDLASAAQAPVLHPRPDSSMQTIAKILSLALMGGSLLASSGCQSPVEQSSAPEKPPPALVAVELGSTERVHECGGFLLASQPGAADLEVAAQRGVRTVVDQRKATEERGFNEVTLVMSLGMTYINPSFSKPSELTDEMFAQSREVLRTAQRPVLMHCQSGNRTGTIWLAYRVLDENIPLEQALQEAKAIGMSSPELEAKARSYIERSRPAQ
jgi:uncharacterized protein (TIGR01244 family)